MDYRYFPDPDLPPLILDKKFIEDRRIAELPIDRRIKYRDTYMLIEDDARILSNDRVTSDFYEQLVALTQDPKKSCSYITTILFALFDSAKEKMSIADIRAEVSEIARVITLVNTDELSSTNSKLVIEKLVFEGGKADAWVDQLGVRQKNDMDALRAIIDTVLLENPHQVSEYQNGKINLF